MGATTWLGSRTISLISAIRSLKASALALIPEGLRRSTRALGARMRTLARRVATLAADSWDAPAERRSGRAESPAAGAKRCLDPREPPHAFGEHGPTPAELRDARPKRPHARTESLAPPAERRSWFARASARSA